MWLLTNSRSGSNSDRAVEALQTHCRDRGFSIARKICFPDEELPGANELDTEGIGRLAIFTGDGTLNATRDRPCVLHLQSREGTRSTTDSDCYVTYMPIDRINDHRSSIALKTMVDEQDSYVIP